MREAIAALEGGTMARAAFGDQVVDHYLNYARTEQGLFDRFVTDWERRRYFERVGAAAVPRAKRALDVTASGAWGGGGSGAG